MLHAHTTRGGFGGPKKVHRKSGWEKRAGMGIRHPARPTFKERINMVYNHPGSHMDGWPVARRETGLLEIFCDHGVGHPMPESVKWLNEHHPAGEKGMWDIHGCDGCCQVQQITECK